MEIYSLIFLLYVGFWVFYSLCYISNEWGSYEMGQNYIKSFLKKKIKYDSYMLPPHKRIQEVFKKRSKLFLYEYFHF